MRIMAEPQMTTTLKYRKADLVREGYDPTQVRDPLYYRDDAGETYQPLDSAATRKIADGSLRF